MNDNKSEPTNVIWPWLEMPWLTNPSRIESQFVECSSPLAAQVVSLIRAVYEEIDDNPLLLADAAHLCEKHDLHGQDWIRSYLPRVRNRLRDVKPGTAKEDHQAIEAAFGISGDRTLLKRRTKLYRDLQSAAYVINYRKCGRTLDQALEIVSLEIVHRSRSSVRNAYYEYREFLERPVHVPRFYKFPRSFLDRHG